MFWLTSISSVVAAGIVLRFLHASDLAKSTFYVLLAATLLLFNLAIASIFAFFLIDALPWTQPQMLIGLVGFTIGLAFLVRWIRPIELRNLPDHKKILITYSAILISVGLVGGLIFGAPAWTKNYAIKSDRWADIATAITIIEITSLYTLLLALIISIGTTCNQSKAQSEIVG